jgi:hypothetical protein
MYESILDIKFGIFMKDEEFVRILDNVIISNRKKIGINIKTISNQK